MLKKYPIVILMLVFMFLLAAQVSAQEPAQPAEIDAPAVLQMSDHGNVFIHTTGVNNITLHYTTITHPLLDGNPNAIVFITQLDGTNDNANFTGVWYSPLSQKWNIYNQNLTTMESGYQYIVQVLSASESVFQVQVPNNMSSYAIDHPLLNGNPLAMLQVTPTFTYTGGNGSIVGEYFDQPLMVQYSNGLDKWLIFSPGDTLPAEASFNIQILNSSSRDLSFVHTATTDNSLAAYTFLDHPLLNGNPSAQLMVTPVRDQYASGDNSMAYYAFGVDYQSSTWTIYNTNLASIIPDGTQFVVTILNTYNQLDNPVANAGFEVGAVDAVGKPHSWVSVGNVKRTCNRLSKGKIVSYEQYCAAQVNGGNGAVNSLTQNLANVGELDSGETAHIGARIMGKNVTSGARIQAVLKLEDGSKLKTKIAADDLLGTYAYKSVKGASTSTLSADPVSIKVRIMHKGTGVLFVDAIYMSDADLSDVLSTSLGTPETNTIPLPVPAQ